MEEQIRLEIKALSELPEVENQLVSIIDLMKQVGLMDDKTSNQMKSNAQEQLTKRAELRNELERERQETARLNSTIVEQRKAIADTNLEKQKSIERSKAMALEMRNVSNNTDILTRSIRGLRDLMAVSFGLSAVKDFTMGVIDAKTAVDRVQVGLETMLQSKAKADALMADVKRLALESPISFEALSDSTFKMIGLGFETKKIIPILEALGNMSAVIGNDKLPLIAKAMADVQNKGKLMAQETKQFADNGVNLYQLLATSMGKTKEEVISLAEQHKISYAQVERAILQASEKGGLYHNQMKLQSSLLGGEMEKLKDQYFFAKDAIGDYSEDGLKQGIKLTSEFIKVTIGSEEAISNTVGILKTIIGTWAAYTVVSKAATVASVTDNAIRKIGNVIKGEAILSNIAYTGSMNVLTASEMAAVTAARTFNATLASNPIGLAVLAIGTLATGYQVYNMAQNETIEKERELKKEMTESAAKILSEHQAFTTLAGGVLDTNKKTSDRLVLLGELKMRYPDVMKGIDTLKDAEIRLGDRMKLVNADFKTRIALALSSIQLSKTQAQIDENNAKMYDLIISRRGMSKTQFDADARTGVVTESSNSAYNIVTNQIYNLMKETEKLGNVQKLALEKNSAYAKGLNFTYEETTKTTNATTEAGKEVDNLSNKKTAAQKKEEKELRDAQNAYNEHLKEVQKFRDEITKSWKKSTDGIIALNKKEQESTEQNTKETRQMLDARSEYFENSEKKKLAMAAKSIDEYLKIIEKSEKEIIQIEIDSSKKTLQDKKNKFDIIKALGLEETEEGKKAKKEMLAAEVAYYGSLTEMTKQDLKQKKDQLEFEATIPELKKRFKNLELESMKKFGVQFSELNESQRKELLKLLEDQENALNEFTAKNKEHMREAMQYTSQIFDEAYSIFARMATVGNKELSQTTENLLILGNTASNVFKNLATGNVTGAVFAVVAGAFDVLMASQERVIAKQKEVAAAFKEQMDGQIQALENILNNTSGISDVYGSLVGKLQEVPETLADIGKYFISDMEDLESRIAGEIKRGELIQKNYETQVSLAKQASQEQIDLITKEYNYKDTLANLFYGQQSLASQQQTINELTALVTNNESKLSLETEFQNKRKGIFDAYSSLIKPITADMSEAEIAGINAAIAARDGQLAKLNEWLIAELAYIINNEGQKRKEYSATETIINAGRERQTALDIQADADRIAREIEKSKKIAEINTELQLTLANLEIAKNEALKASFQDLVNAYNSGYESILNSMQQALNAGSITLEQYDQLIKKLEYYKQILGSDVAPLPVPNINIPGFPVIPNFDFNIPGFYHGTEYLKGASGIDNVLIRANVGERIIPTYENQMIGDISNTELAKLAQNYRASMNMTNIPQFNYNIDVPKIESENKMLVAEIRLLKNELSNLKQVTVETRNGVTTVKERTKNRIVKHIGNSKIK